MTDPLSTALDSLFADPPAAEAGGYGAPRAGIKGGSAWARLVKGALTPKGGSLGHVSAWLRGGKLKLSGSPDGTVTVMTDGVTLCFAGDANDPLMRGVTSPPISGAQLERMIKVQSPIHLAVGAHWVPVCLYGQWSYQIDAVVETLLSLFDSSGYTLGDKTLRATSPCDITLSLEGEQVVATFQPPLKVSKSVLSFSVARLNVTETQVHVVVDGFLGKDQYIGLE